MRNYGTQMTDPKDPKDGWVGGGEKSAPGIDFK